LPVNPVTAVPAGVPGPENPAGLLVTVYEVAPVDPVNVTVAVVAPVEVAETDVGAEGADFLLKTPDLAKKPIAPKELNAIIIINDIFNPRNKQIVKIHINLYSYYR
jgi:hypothetical protein